MMFHDIGTQIPSPRRPSPPPCIPGCSTAHRVDDGFWPCIAEVGSVAVPARHGGQPESLTVSVVRDADLDGALHERGVLLGGATRAGLLSPGDARLYAALLCAAADRAERAG